MYVSRSTSESVLAFLGWGLVKLSDVSKSTLRNYLFLGVLLFAAFHRSPIVLSTHQVFEFAAH